MFSFENVQLFKLFQPSSAFLSFHIWKFSSLCLLSFFIHSASCSATETVQLSACLAFYALSAFSFSAFSSFQQYIQQISLRPSAFTLYFRRKCNLSSYSCFRMFFSTFQLLQILSYSNHSNINSNIKYSAFSAKFFPFILMGIFSNFILLYVQLLKPFNY